MQAVLNNVSTPVGKPRIIAQLEEGQKYIPETLRLIAAIIQESLAELVSPLLMIGLILSMSNFLLDGAVFGASAAIPVIWVIVQSVAVDANLGVMVVRGVNNFHRGEYAKGIIYLAIAVALLFVAAIITDVEAVRSVLDKSLDVIFAHLYISVEALTFVRSSAIVALVAATQLEHVSLRRRASASVAPAQPTQPQSDFPHIEESSQVRVGDQLFASTEEALQHLHDLAPLAREQYTEQRHIEQQGTGGDTDELTAINTVGTQAEQRLIEVSDEQHDKLMQAWKKLSPAGHLSIRQLQRSANVRREVAAYWFNNACWKDELWLDIPATPGIAESEMSA